MPRSSRLDWVKEKICPSCNKLLPREAFHAAYKRPTGLAAHCKTCRKTRYPYTPDKAKLSHLRQRYGLEWEDYVLLWEGQDKRCAICTSPIKLHGKTNSDVCHVDHCHTTGKIRGLLCGHCNKAIGMFFDNPDIIYNAYTYLLEVKDGSKEEI